MQSAYTLGHSVETALLRVQNDILHALDQKKCVALILLDVSAAFDTLDDLVLRRTLKTRIGFDGIILDWFSSYLSSRIQQVNTDNSLSEPIKLCYGVPQGSVLRPILFTLYTPPLANIVRNHNLSFQIYADDTQLYVSFNPNDETDDSRKT
eukprot:GHVU01162097.1.p1 GENE.GHVU01162097.1~~GHVU01162097.1.p1  ORF type:complete len:151 (-),score=1.78 GHVU01162097.1:174-626(-)